MRRIDPTDFPASLVARNRLAALSDEANGSARRLVPAEAVLDQDAPQPQVIEGHQGWPISSGFQGDFADRDEQWPKVVGHPENLEQVSVVTSVVRNVLDFSKSHLVGIGIVLLGGCLWAMYSVSQVQSAEILPESQISSSSAGAESVSATAMPEAAETVPEAVPETIPNTTEPAVEMILVHVIGEVNQPGVVSLPSQARVQDAIAAVGGLTAEADPGELNMASQLRDGVQIVVGRKGKPRGEIRDGPGGGTSSSSGSSGSASASQKVSLNQASQSELETLPGVGPVMAGKILAWREEHNGFSSIAQLQQISGIGSKTYAQIAPNVTT